MSRTPRGCLATTVALLVAVWLASSACTRAQASPTATAAPEPQYAEYAAAIDAGLAAFQADRFAEARRHFARAHALRPSARTQRALGLADVALDNFTVARAELEAALEHSVDPLSEEQRREVTELLQWMQTSLATVRLEYTPAQATARIDATAAPLGDILLEPGEHQLQISAPGFQPHEQRFHLTLTSEPLRLRVSLIASEPASPLAAADVSTGSATWLWVGGTGAAAVVAGAVMFAFGRSDLDTIEDPTWNGDTIAEAASRRSRGQWLTGVGIGTAGLGLAGIVVAAVLRINQNTREEGGDLSYALTPWAASVSRRF